MSSSGSSLSYGQLNAYERLIESFSAAVEDAGGRLKVPDVPLRSCFTPQGTASVKFKRCLYLRDCPCKKKPSGQRMDIAISVCEEITPNCWSLDRSTVYVNYFFVEGQEATLVQALHYDFFPGGQAGHPFFHVHLTAELICLAEFHDLGVELQREVGEIPIITRIPTSDMTLASVLYCLAADHLEPAIFEKFAKDVHAIEGKLPTLRFDALKESLEGNRDHFKSSHWFAHMLKKERGTSDGRTQTIERRQAPGRRRQKPPAKAKVIR
jgi:hypothetical protein